jgi:hypothetical protein
VSCQFHLDSSIRTHLLAVPARYTKLQVFASGFFLVADREELHDFLRAVLYTDVAPGALVVVHLMN